MMVKILQADVLVNALKPHWVSLKGRRRIRVRNVTIPYAKIFLKMGAFGRPGGEPMTISDPDLSKGINLSISEIGVA